MTLQRLNDVLYVKRTSKSAQQVCKVLRSIRGKRNAWPMLRRSNKKWAWRGHPPYSCIFVSKALTHPHQPTSRRKSKGVQSRVPLESWLAVEQYLKQYQRRKQSKVEETLTQTQATRAQTETLTRTLTKSWTKLGTKTSHLLGQQSRSGGASQSISHRQGTQYRRMYGTMFRSKAEVQMMLKKREGACGSQKTQRKGHLHGRVAMKVGSSLTDCVPK